jgi:hypothetical protein
MMNNLRSPLRRAAPFTAVILMALALAGCSKKITAVDPSYTSPEGQPEVNARQIVYPDIPTPVARWKDALPNCDPCFDSLVAVTQSYRTGPGVINGVIFDGTPASTYEILRRENTGGYAPLYDYPLNPSARFAQSGWKLFTWLDRRPSGFDPPTYLGRGVVAGVTTRTTPLTNVSLCQMGNLADISLTESSLQWTPVPGAVGYVLQIYAIKSGDLAALIYNASPAPLASEDHRDYLVAWLPAVNGTIDYNNMEVLAEAAIITAPPYLMRVSAVDAQGRLVGFSFGANLKATGAWIGEGYSLTFPLGAFLIGSPSNSSAKLRAWFSAATAPAAPQPRELSIGQVKLRFSDR